MQSPPPAFVGHRSNIAVGVSVSNASPDDIIEKTRVLVFNSMGILISNEESVVTPQADDTYLINALVINGINHLYIICNETEDIKNSLAKVVYMRDIEKLTYSDISTTPPLSMFAKVSDIQISIDESDKAWATINGGTPTNVINATVIRTMAKLSMTVIKNTGSGTKFAVEELSYKVCRMPRYSNLMEGTTYPQGAGWRNDLKVTDPDARKLSLDGDGQYSITDGVYTVPSGVDYITMPDAYIPEHLPIEKEHPDYCTYLLIEAKCRLEGSSMAMNVNYKVDIGNNPPIDNSLKRNTHYKIYATIKNLGAMGFYAEIVPVDQVDVPVNWKPFEGYVIVSERESEYGSNSNIWNDYSQYTGILKISKDKVYSNALFRYGSVVALSDATTALDFNPASDVLWQPGVTPTITSWSDVGYITSGNIPEAGDTLGNIKLGKGDPCRLAGLTNDEIAAGTTDNKLWRMPTADEMAWINTAKNDTPNTNGFYSFSYLLTPNSGHRLADGKMVPQIGGGYYWSSTDRKSFVFNSQTNIGIEEVGDPEKAYAVRCIRTTVHPSRLEIKSPINIPFLGCTAQSIKLDDAFNTPYWKMSVDSPIDFTFVKNIGTNKEAGSFTVTQLPNVYQSRTYTITATGYGLDGVVHQVPVVVNQLKLVHQVTISLKSPDLTIESGYPRLPADGIALTFGISMTPEGATYPPYNVTFPTAKWKAQCKYYDNQLHYEVGTEALYSGTSTVTIPANNYGHPRAIEVEIIAPDFPSFSQHLDLSVHKMVFIQATN